MECAIRINPEEMCKAVYEGNALPLEKPPGGSIGTEFGMRLFGNLYEVASAYVIQRANGGESCICSTRRLHRRF